MQRATCVEEARQLLTVAFGVDTTGCDELLQNWLKQTQLPVGKIADVLVHQIWEGDQTADDRALVRFLETHLRRLPETTS